MTAMMPRPPSTSRALVDSDDHVWNAMNMYSGAENGGFTPQKYHSAVTPAAKLISVDRIGLRSISRKY